MKGFNYSQALLDSKDGKTPVSARRPAEQKQSEAVNRAEVEAKQRPSVPEEPFGAGLVHGEPARTDPAKMFEFGGSGSGQQSEPVEEPPESVPTRPQVPKSHPKPEVQSPHGGAGVDDYFSDEDDYGDDGEEFLPPSDEGVEPDEDAADMSERTGDDAAVSRMTDDEWREQERARIEAEVRAEESASGKRGGKTRQPKSVKQRPRKHVDASKVPMSRLRNIPTCLVDRAKALFPASRQEDAVAAYIYFREGMPADLEVPDEIAELASKYTGESVTVETVKDIVERDISDLKVQNRVLAQKMEAIELAAVYAIFEAIGFRKADQVTPETVDFLEQGMADLINRLENQAAVKHQRDVRRAGRPIR